MLLMLLYTNYLMLFVSIELVHLVSATNGKAPTKQCSKIRMYKYLTWKKNNKNKNYESMQGFIVILVNIFYFC